MTPPPVHLLVARRQTACGASPRDTKHKLIWHGAGYDLWAECSCRETDGDGWLWLNPYTLVQGAARRKLGKTEWRQHVNV